MKFGLWYQESPVIYRRADIDDDMKFISVYLSVLDGAYCIALFDEISPSRYYVESFEEAFKIADDILRQRGIDFVDSKFEVMK